MSEIDEYVELFLDFRDVVLQCFLIPVLYQVQQHGLVTYGQ